MNLIDLLDTIRGMPDCNVYAPKGIPSIHQVHRLPEDLQQFFTLCGGIDLYFNSGYSISIVLPEKLALANLVIWAGFPQELIAPIDHISWSWYIIAEGRNSQYITIDLSLERLGNCYDSYWDSYANPGDTPIIARSFTDLLFKLVNNRGMHWYWLAPDFESMGDAFDSVP